MHEVLVNRLGGLSLPRKSVVRLTDRPDMTLDVYRGRRTTIQQQLSGKIVCAQENLCLPSFFSFFFFGGGSGVLLLLVELLLQETIGFKLFHLRVSPIFQ